MNITMLKGQIKTFELGGLRIIIENPSWEYEQNVYIDLPETIEEPEGWEGQRA